MRLERLKSGLKGKYYKEHKIKLIEIPYTQKKNINVILKKELKTK